MSAREAWEYIAPELPPGKEWVQHLDRERKPHGTGWDIMFTRNNGAKVMVVNGSYHRETRKYHASVAWELFAEENGIDRRQHAEDIAPRRVREVAEAKWPRCTIRYTGPAHLCDARFEVRLFVVQSETWETFCLWEGPDICTAAWRCMLAMTEEMPEAERAELLGVSVEILREALEVE